jgi:hypothetical protein
LPAKLAPRLRKDNPVLRSDLMTAHPCGVFAASLGLVLAACTQLPPTDAPVEPRVKAGAANPAREDTNSRFIGLIGTKAQHAPPFLGVPETNFYCLRTFVDRQTGETRHQLYVSDSYSGTERGWDAARDSDGHVLRFLEISRSPITCDGGCSYAEEFAADIPDGELRTNRRGLKVIFSARSGAEKTIAVTGTQIAAQLAAIDTRQSPAQPAPPATFAVSPPSPPHQ